jgi:hypothetical protein
MGKRKWHNKIVEKHNKKIAITQRALGIELGNIFLY